MGRFGTRWIFLFRAITFCFLALFVTTNAGANIGAEWLAAQSQIDGSYATANDVANPYQSTAETLRALTALEETAQPGIPGALQYLGADTYPSTEHLSRLIIAKVENGDIVNDLVAELESMQNVDGGFGEFGGYDSTVLDTAFALEALSIGRSFNSQLISWALGFVAGQQNVDGGFSLGAANESSIYIAAQASIALQKHQFSFNVGAQIDAVNAFLEVNKGASGAWATDWETALALIAIIPVTSDTTQYVDALTVLEAAQLADGSWSGDVYSTALALRALQTANTTIPQDPSLGTLAGRVTDGLTGDPMAGATITVEGSEIKNTQTDANGRYVITNITPGEVNLSASLNGYIDTQVSVTVVTGTALDVNLVLIRDPAPVSLRISGVVVDAGTGSSLAGADVQIINSAIQTQTAADGSFSLSGLVAGSYTVEIRQSGYATSIHGISAPSGGDVNLGVIELFPVDANATTGIVVGKITDAQTGSPLRGVEISLSGSDNKLTHTDLDGRFQITDVTPGNVNLSAVLTGYRTASGSGQIVAGTTLNFVVKLVKEGNPASVTIIGKVEDAQTHAPLSGALIRETGNGNEVQSGADGAFLLTDVPAGTFNVHVSQTGYVSLTYALSASGGGLADLGTVALAPDIPITDNQSPIIQSEGPVQAVVGQIYEYLVQAYDPDGDPLTYGLSSYPNGMEIEPSIGLIRWIPTSDQAGQQTFTLIVVDENGGVAEQSVIVEVQANGYPTYVVTDVETLNGLTVDELTPNNYVLGSLVAGGRGSTWKAVSPDGCGFAYFTPASGLEAEKQAAEALDFWSMGSGSGNDAIWDLGNQFSSVSVFPLIDHAPFPEEGIEYTIWGSDDPDAPFPDGWTLATLVTIYGQGWADNRSLCSTTVNIDDYVGLYTFGGNAFRYIRLKADNSISIFSTPEHTSYSTYADNSGLPGWQSVESEIDGVGGMVCDVKPIAEAGEPILGQTGEGIQFDASGSQGDIRIYGWDLDGDSEIDLTGSNPTHIFNAGFDRDVTLLVIDDKGCVGTDTVHVTIGLSYPKPDLVVPSITLQGTSTNLFTLAISGSAQVTVHNIGNAAAIQPALVTLFEDINNNEAFDPGVDNELSSRTMPSGLAKDESLMMNMAVNGTVSFRDAPIYAFVDSDNRVDEKREDNNLGVTSASCKLLPLSLGDFDFAEKWYWSGDPQIPDRQDVYGPVVVVQLSDDNSDGEINALDNPDVLFTVTLSGGNGRLVAVDGETGQTLWVNTDVAVSGYGSPAAADIDGDGLVEVIIPNIDRLKLYAFEHDGTLKWTAGTGPKFINVPRDAVAVADLDHDGDVEIIHGRRAFDHLGNLLWEGDGDYGGDFGYGFLPIVIDLDMQGGMEVIAGRTAYRADGTIFWKRLDLPSGGGFTAVGNFNDDDFPEVVLIAGGRVYLLDHTGQTIWGPVGLPGGGEGGAPTVGDFDGDGEPEIGIAGANNYVVLETDGSVKWTSPTQDVSSRRTGSSIFDFNADGKVEVVYADELYLRVYSGVNGDIIKQLRLGSGTTLEYPVIADIDGDGRAEIVVGSNNAQFSSRKGVFALEAPKDNWAPTRAIWNQHSYHINNVNDDGTIPQFEEPSWLSHNTFRLNAFPDQDPTKLADLTASMLKVIDNGAGQPASLSVRIGNAGAGSLPIAIGVAFYEGDPNAGGILLGTVSISNLAVGEYIDAVLDNVTSLTGTADIYAVADYDDRLIECNEANNQVSLPVLAQSSAGEITVATDLPLYGANSPVALQAAVANTSGVPGAFRAELRIEDLQGTVMASFDPQSIDSLAGSSVLNLTRDWDTGTYIVATYRLHGLLYGVDGLLLDEDISEFSIRHPDEQGPAVSLRTATDRPVYHTSDTALLDNLVRNLTVNVLVSDASLRLRVVDPTGNAVFNQEVSLGELLAGGSRQVLIPFPFIHASIGTYPVYAEVVDADDQVMATDQTTFEVQEDLSQSLVGQVAVSMPVVYAGEMEICTDIITNTGVTNLNALSLRQIWVNPDAEEELSNTVAEIGLIAGETKTLARELDTTGLTEGHYACILQAQIESVWVSLASAGFEVLEPPIRITGELTQGTGGRILVLADAPEQPAGSCTAMIHLSMSTIFDVPMAANSELVTNLYDPSEQLLDSEQLLLSEFDTVHNRNIGENGMDLSVAGFTGQSLSLVLDGTLSTNGYLGDDYRITAAVTDGANALQLDTGLIHTQCQEARVAGEHFGPFMIDSFSGLNVTNDQHGPIGSPSESAQFNFVQRLLDESGWQYTLVTDAKGFEYEFYQGGYTAYALLSEQVKLPETLQKAVREAVYRGEGLMVAGDHEQRNHNLSDALGISYHGKEPKAYGVELIDSELHTTQQLALQLSDKAINVSLNGAANAGHFLIDSNTPDTVPAVAYQQYGIGSAVHVSYDLLAEATLFSRLDGTHADLILSALEYVVPATITLQQGTSFPLTLTLTNEGIATPGRVVITLPDGVILIDGGIAFQQADGTVIWPFNLQEQEVQQLTLWLQPQAAGNSVTIDALIQTGEDPDYVDHDSLSLTLTLEYGPALTEVLAELIALESQDNAYRKALDLLMRAESELALSNNTEAINSLIKCSDELIKLDTSEAAAVRLKIGEVLRLAGLAL